MGKKTNAVHIESENISEYNTTDLIVVSPGQPYDDHIEDDPDGNDLSFTLKSGRHGTQSVAAQFHQYCGDNHMGAQHNMRAYMSPGKLNFFFAVDITLDNGKSGRVYLGQGHYSEGFNDVNNWWIGGDLVEWDENSESFKFGGYILRAHHDEFYIG